MPEDILGARLAEFSRERLDGRPIPDDLHDPEWAADPEELIGAGRVRRGLA
ncbi:hypothetical protein [Streptomyces sp. HD]|uniref:hypothetical protein n=1 Tax=Streptomyces sp. HD TaxID=3020892 RepID=UPI00232B52F5|nr:hypothetical protein [Streptomyces sp. HD]MDC0772440.1 hypothetical protein [Streptomyces sp. HD]